MPFEIIQNDIVRMHTDAIVNTANPEPAVGSGVDYAIHKKAGRKLLEARKKIGRIGFGQAVITPGFDLDAKYVIHTSGPIWSGGNHDEAHILKSCYRNSLRIAKDNGCESIAFPLIATGNYGFPKQLALEIAVDEIRAFLTENDMQIYLVVFGKEAFVLSEKLVKSVSSYIDDNYIERKKLDEYRSDSFFGAQRAQRFERNAMTGSIFPIRQAPSARSRDMAAESVCAASDDLDTLLNNLDSGFSETLLKLIDRTGKKDSEIYKKANVDRKLFSKIRTNSDYKPSKTTALAFALALELDITETRDFIGRAGFALSHSSKFDVIVEYFIINKNYNIFELNEVLFAFDQPLIGA